MTRIDPSMLLSVNHRALEYTVRNVFETIAVLDGFKPVMRLVLSDEYIPLVAHELRAFGLAVSASTWGLRPAYTTSLGDVYTDIDRTGTRRCQRVVAVARSASSADAFLQAETDGDHEAMGYMLGYPRCCMRAYQDLSEKRDWLTELLEHTSPHARYPHQTNRVAYLFDEHWLGFDYFPCSLLCADTKNIFETVARLARESGMHALVDQITTDLRAPILLKSGVVVQLRGASCADGMAKYDLSRSRLYGWRVEEGADEDPIWTSDQVERINGELRFYRERRLLASSLEDVSSTRLLVFE
jgi:hypothetical protein